MVICIATLGRSSEAGEHVTDYRSGAGYLSFDKER